MGRNRFNPLVSNYTFKHGRESDFKPGHFSRTNNSFLGQEFPPTAPDPMQYMLKLEGKVNQLMEMVQNLPQSQTPVFTQQNLNQNQMQTHLNQQETHNIHQQGFWNNSAPPVQHQWRSGVRKLSIF